MIAIQKPMQNGQNRQAGCSLRLMKQLEANGLEKASVRWNTMIAKEGVYVEGYVILGFFVHFCMFRMLPLLNLELKNRHYCLTNSHTIIVKGGALC